MEQKPSRIVWAIDPFSSDRAGQESAARLIRSLAEGIATEVEPVYFLGGDVIDVNDARVRGEVELGRILASSGLGRIEGLRRLKMLSRPESTISQGVAALIAHARESGAELIVVSTRAQGGPKRWVLGSFAETLALQSDIPFVTVNPSWRGDPKLGRVLFPTDFSDDSRVAFDQVVEFCRRRGSTLVVFHESLEPWIGFDPAFAAYAQLEELLEERIARNEKVGEDWIARAQARGVSVVLEMVRRKGGAVVDGILEESRNAGMIAMAARCSRYQAALLGSTTRKVIRAAECPVWVMHPCEPPEAASDPGPDDFELSDERDIA